EDAAAVAPLRKAVELLPAESRPRYLLAVALDHSGDRSGAAEAFEALLHLYPNDITAIEYLGWMNLRNGKPAEAEARFRRAVEVQPKGADGFRGLAESLEAQKKPQAVDAYRQYLELRPRSEEHTSELQSPYDLVCRLLLEKKNQSEHTSHNLDRPPP